MRFFLFVAMALLPVLGLACDGRTQDLPFRSWGDFYATDRTNDEVYHFIDRNRDGDIQDAGEQFVFYDDSSPGPNLSNPQALTIDPRDGSVWIADATLDVVLRLHDRNGDGDANDAAEFTVYYDNTGAIPLGAVNALCFDAAGGLFLCVAGKTAAQSDQILRLTDRNNDGDALDAGEAVVYLDNTATSGAWLTEPAAMVIRRGELYLADLNSTPDAILRVRDLNNDGDAQDASEVVRWAAPRAAGASSVWSVEFDFFADALYAIDLLNGNVYRFEDLNRDGDALDGGEATLFFDSLNNASQVSLTASFSLTTAPTGLGVVYASNHSRGVVYRLEDLNADGDANDASEVTVYADNAGSPPLVRPFGTLRDCVFGPAGVFIPGQPQPSIGGTAVWALDDLLGGGRPYVAAISFGNAGIPLGAPDIRVIPVTFDILLLLGLTGQLPMLQGAIGTLSNAGQSVLILTVPNEPGLINVTLHLAFVTFEPKAPSGIQTVSEPHAFTIGP